MKNEKNQPRSRRSLKVQDLETTGVEVKGGSDPGMEIKESNHTGCQGMIMNPHDGVERQ